MHSLRCSRVNPSRNERGGRVSGRGGNVEEREDSVEVVDVSGGGSVDGGSSSSGGGSGLRQRSRKGTGRRSGKNRGDDKDEVVVEDVSGGGGRVERVDNEEEEEDVDDVVVIGEGRVSSSTGGGRNENRMEEGGNRDARMMCQFCLIKYPLWEIVDHAEACGSRTEVCEVCLGYVRMKDMWRHRESGCEVGVTGPARIVNDEGGYVDGVRREFGNLIGERPDAERLIEMGRNGLRRVRSRVDELSPQARTAARVAVGAAAAAAFIGLLRR